MVMVAMVVLLDLVVSMVVRLVVAAHLPVNCVARLAMGQRLAELFPIFKNQRLSANTVEEITTLQTDVLRSLGFPIARMAIMDLILAFRTTMAIMVFRMSMLAFKVNHNRLTIRLEQLCWLQVLPLLNFGLQILEPLTI